MKSNSNGLMLEEEFKTARVVLMEIDKERNKEKTLAHHSNMYSQSEKETDSVGELPSRESLGILSDEELACFVEREQIEEERYGR